MLAVRRYRRQLLRGTSAGEVLVDGEYRRLKMRRDDEGRVWGSSPALGMDLSWDDGRLRFYDLERGEFRRNLAEAEDAYGLERAARQDAEARAADAEDRWRRTGQDTAA